MRDYSISLQLRRTLLGPSDNAKGVFTRIDVAPDANQVQASQSHEGLAHHNILRRKSVVHR